MVTLIPRHNSLAVSGTPAKTDIKDLMGSLRFLGVPVLPTNPKIWHRLQQPAMRSAFEGLFRELAVRTTKVAVSFRIASLTEIAFKADSVKRRFKTSSISHSNNVSSFPSPSPRSSIITMTIHSPAKRISSVEMPITMTLSTERDSGSVS